MNPRSYWTFDPEPGWTEGQEVSLSLTGAGDAVFDIDSDTGQINVKDALDFEADQLL